MHKFFQGAAYTLFILTIFVVGGIIVNWDSRHVIFPGTIEMLAVLFSGGWISLAISESV